MASPATVETHKRPRQVLPNVQRANGHGKLVVGALLEMPSLATTQLTGLTSGHFLPGYERSIFTAIENIIAEGRTPDMGTVIVELSGVVPPDYVVECTKGIIPENFPQCKRKVIEADRERRYHALREVLGTLTDQTEILSCLQQLQAIMEENGAENDWHSLFHSREDFATAAPLEFRINGFLQDAGITIIGGLSGHGKTLLMMAMAKALLEGSPLFGYDLFSVPAPVKRVVYLVPESALGPFWSRIKLFRLEEFAGNAPSDRLLVHTLSKHEPVKLDDPGLLKAAEGADIFLDTAVRFMDGSENDVEGTRPFADLLFRLLNAGARSICGAHHSPKSFSNAEYMSLENILRGSGDIGAMLATAWGVRQIDAASNRLFIENCKPRDFQPCQPFILEGRPHLDLTGNFKMIAAPGEAGELRDHLNNGGGRPETSDKAGKLSKAVSLRAQGKSIREISRIIGTPKSTIEGWLFEFDSSNKGQA